MKLEQQVVSLELAKQLKEAGYPQDESLFYWTKPFDINQKFTGDELELYGLDWLDYFEMEYAKVYAAPTVAELGEKMTNFSNSLPHYEPDNGWVYVDRKSPTDFKVFNDKTEVNARAKMWLYLKKEGLL